MGDYVSAATSAEPDLVRVSTAVSLFTGCIIPAA
jgi:hypothetical protein